MRSSSNNEVAFFSFLLDLVCHAIKIESKVQLEIEITQTTDTKMFSLSLLVWSLIKDSAIKKA